MSPGIIKSLSARTIEFVPVCLGPRDSLSRSLYWVPGVKRWCDNADTSSARPKSMLSPSSEINQAFADFVSGKPLAGGFTRCDPPAGEGVWKLHTAHVRFFSWCVEPQCLVLTGAEWKHMLKGKASPTYAELSRNAVKVRNLMGFSDYYAGDIRSAFPATC